jgi:Tol biopolymer transport system component
VAFDRASGKRAVLTDGERPFVASGGLLFYETRGSLWATEVAEDGFSRVGEPFAVARDASAPSLSRDGTLVYIGTRGGQQQLVWKDRAGQELAVGQPQARMDMPALSPDLTRVLVAAGDGPEIDVWLHDPGRGLKSRLTVDGTIDRPAWHAGGTRISYTSFKSGTPNVYTQLADGGAPAERLITSPWRDFGTYWSPDDEYLMFDRYQTEANAMDIWYLLRKAGGGFEEAAFMRTEFDELAPVLSPNKRYVAFESNRSGKYEIYVRPFPRGAGEWQMSSDGGRQPRWRGDTAELYYVKDGETIMAVPISLIPSFSAGVARPLIKHPGTLRGRGQQYDVTPDGQRFILIKSIEPPTSVIRVVENWLTEFRGLQKR